MAGLSPIVEKAFRKWINTPTWYTGHPCDEERFYRFVWTIVRFSRRPPSESLIRELIASTWDGKLESEFLGIRALEYSHLYATLYEFAKIRNKPIPFLLDKEGNPVID
jgi:hypothetical protein